MDSESDQVLDFVPSCPGLPTGEAQNLREADRYQVCLFIFPALAFGEGTVAVSIPGMLAAGPAAPGFDIWREAIGMVSSADEGGEGREGVEGSKITPELSPTCCGGYFHRFQDELCIEDQFATSGGAIKNRIDWFERRRKETSCCALCNTA